MGFRILGLFLDKIHKNSYYTIIKNRICRSFNQNKSFKKTELETW